MRPTDPESMSFICKSSLRVARGAGLVPSSR
ncbi:hypothetical protein PSCLAVI8L_80135 [Pseudoclavibacter sp. 8L]|nr:hypothetical protein PSCLAVI8L_80135 [Pseudoclavibacter sp. 8L]